MRVINTVLVTSSDDNVDDTDNDNDNGNDENYFDDNDDDDHHHTCVKLRGTHVDSTSTHGVGTTPADRGNVNINNCHSSAPPIDSLLANNSFWRTYTVYKSLADGHCLLHSVVSSYNSQLITMGELTMAKLQLKMYNVMN